MGPGFMILAALILWGLGWVILFRITSCNRCDGTHPLPSVSVVIPARNEEQNLPVLLASLQGQSFRPAEILVVDDASSDATADVARKGGARVLASANLPQGWRGKPWACHQGAAATRGELLCFVDADTWFDPDGLRRVVTEWTRHQGALSLAAWHDVKTWTEQLSAFFNLMMTAGIGAFTIAGDRIPPAGLFGPFLMISRRAYQAAGGHAAVKDRILENVNMAAFLKQAGVPVRCRGGRGILSIRMYPHGIRELSAGWAKAFAAGAANTPPWLMVPAVGWLTGAIIAFSSAAAAAFSPALAIHAWMAVYLLYGLQFAFTLRHLGRFKWANAILYPVPLIFYLIVFMVSLHAMLTGKHVVWKGRQIQTDTAGKATEHAD